MSDPAQLPFELVEIIISEFWYSEHPSDDRITFMTGCPLVCSLWRDIYASITSRDIYVPTVPYLFYLCSIIRSQNSSIYRQFLPESTCAMTCHVDLIKSDSDSAMFPYLVFCHIPSYVGFRKCFPNIQYIHLETKFLPEVEMDVLGPEPYYMPRMLSHRIIRTRVSIRLDRATTQPSDLPVDWCVTVDGSPDIDEADPSEVEWPWTFFVCELMGDMIQYSWLLRYMLLDISSHSSATKGSGGALRFYGRTCCEEQRKDIWGINHRFWKAGRTSKNLKTFLSDLHDEPCWDDYPEAMRYIWRRTFGVERALGTNDQRSSFTLKHGTVVLL